MRGATGDALRLLRQHVSRGNVRELEAVPEQAAIFTRGDWITAEDLDLLRTARSGAKSAPRPGALGSVGFSTRRCGSPASVASSGAASVSREAARRELTALVQLGLLRLMGRGRGGRYVPLSPG